MMFAKLKSLEYPVSGSMKEILASSFFVALTGYLFLVVFQPFGAEDLTEFKYLLLLPYALIAFAAYTWANIAVGRKDRKWSLYNELAKMLYVMLVCSVLNYVYNIFFINHVGFSIGHLVQMHGYTFAVTIPISMTYVLGRYIYLKKDHAIPEMTLSEPSVGKMLTISPDNGPEALTLREDDFIFAESEGNYSTIHYLNNGMPDKQLLRLSLKNLEEQVRTGSIIRCHRSFVINTRKVAKMKGNAQGYKLVVENAETFVPVSRNYIAEVKKQVKAL